MVLAVQDTTEVDWTAHPATKGLGPLGHTACQGLLVHSTLAFTPERVPLGLVAQQVWARDPDDIGKRARRKQLPISQKESQKWLTSLDAVCSARDECPQTRLVSVGDREADVYDLLAAARPAGVELLIGRRGTAVSARHSAMCGPLLRPNPWWRSSVLQVPRRGAQPAREATLALRFCPLTLVSAPASPGGGLARGGAVGRAGPGSRAPGGGEADRVAAVDHGRGGHGRGRPRARRVVRCRWGIEVWHRILKSGCHIEARQLATDERLERCLTLYSVMAWRVFYAIMLARAVPEMPCDVLLEIEAWQALYGAIHHCPTPPGESTLAGRGRALDRAARRLCGAPPPRPTRG